MSATPKGASRRNGARNRLDVDLDGCFLDVPNDDEAEKQQRQQALVLELQAQHIESPATPSSRRRSTAPFRSSLTDSQLAEHYANCIRLSTENKINTKNAFSLHLIDFIRDVVKNEDGTTNFQAASCTLDASAKIYAYRVDRIHAETYQIAGELGIVTHKKKPPDHAEDGKENAGGGKGRQTRKSKPGTTIVNNPKTITLDKLETTRFRDPLHEKISENHQDGTSAGLILNHVRSLDDSGYLMFDPKFVPKRDPNFKKHSSTVLKFTSFLKDALKKAATRKEEYCPTLAHMLSYERCSEDPFMDVDPESMAAYRFHMSADASDLDRSASFDGGDNETIPPETEDGVPAVITNCNTADIKKFLAPVPSDYSYFTKQFLTAWAGPSHWRVKPISKTKQPGQEGTRKKAEKGPVCFDFETAVPPDASAFAPSKRTHLLTEHAMSQWREDKLLLPQDRLRCRSKIFRSLFVCKAQKIMMVAEPGEVDVGPYDYDNPRDVEDFCPNEPTYDEDGNDDFPGGEDFPEPPPSVLEHTPRAGEQTVLGRSVRVEADYVGDYLVKQPYKVPRIQINYARFAKRFDMKQMKEALWKVVTDGKEFQDNVTGEEERSKGDEPSETAEPDETAKPDESAETTRPEETAEPSKRRRTSFRYVWRRLPPELNKLNRESVSIPIAFTALLHLATEKNFTLTGLEDMSDVFVNV